MTDASVALEVESGTELRELATALVLADTDAVGKARDRVVDQLGQEAAVAAIGVVANFQMMNRALDAVGIPTHLDRSIADALGIDPDTFGGAHGWTDAR